MSLPYNKLLQLSPSIYSLCFESPVDFDINCYADYLKDKILELEEVICTFDRISLFFTKEMSRDLLEAKLKAIGRLKGTHSSSLVWEVPLYFGKYSNDLLNYFQGDERAVSTYRKRFLALNFQLIFYGFLPGFGYLSGLPKSMHLDRKPNPIAIEKGDVAVGGGQVGIYPQASPGGWQRIGHCPVSWFNVNQAPYVQIHPTSRATP